MTGRSSEPILAGWSWHQLRTAARVAVGHARGASDRWEAFETALSAIAEALLTTPDEEDRPLRWGELMVIGAAAIDRDRMADLRHQGVDVATGQRRRAFRMVWLDWHTQPRHASPDAWVDAAAVWQVLPLLTDLQRRIAGALMAGATRRQVSDALGLTLPAVHHQVARMRPVFEEHWLGGSLPRRWRRTGDRCKWGHPMPPQERRCRTCQHVSERASYRRHRRLAVVA